MSRRFRPFYVSAGAVITIGLLGTVLVPKAHADTWEKKTIVTVSEPIIAGNTVLAPGTYVWKLVDTRPNQEAVVQVFDKGEKHLEATATAIPNHSLRADGSGRLAFWEAPAGVPKPVRAWFIPGDKFGQEFSYPKQLVTQLASTIPADSEPRTVSSFASANSLASTAAPISNTSALPSHAENAAAPLASIAGVGSLALAGLISLAKHKPA